MDLVAPWEHLVGQEVTAIEIGAVRREGVDLGLTYRGKRWKTSLQASANVPSSLELDPFTLDKRYAVEVGGAYALTPRLSLQGGMRYQLSSPSQDRLQLDERGDGTIYLGTAFSF